MRARWGAVLAIAVLAAALPAAAEGATYYVQKSAPGASDANLCTVASAPCLTIQGAVDKADDATGNEVRILGADIYTAGFRTPGLNNPVTVNGAGPGDTRIDAASAAAGCVLSAVVCIENASTVRGIHIVATGAVTGLSAFNSGGLVENVHAESPLTGFAGGVGTMRDSSFDGLQNSVSNGRYVRTRFTGGLSASASFGTIELIDSTIVKTGVTGVSLCPAGTGLCVVGPVAGSGTVLADHVTVAAPSVRVAVVASGSGTVAFGAWNSTLAGAAGKDLRLDGAASATLERSNVGVGRIEQLNGALLTVVDSIDVAPLLTSDGHLLAGSPLRDRGLAGVGALAGIEDTLDIDRQPRIQGPAPDIGSDELAPLPLPGGGPPPPKPVPPKLSKVSLAKSFRATCPKSKRRGKRCKVKLGVTIKASLDRAATVKFSFKRKSTRRKLRKTYSFSKKLKTGVNKFRFSGKIRRRALPKARYTLTIVATGPEGLKSAAVKKSVRVK